MEFYDNNSDTTSEAVLFALRDAAKRVKCPCGWTGTKGQAGYCHGCASCPICGRYVYPVKPEPHPPTGEF